MLNLRLSWAVVGLCLSYSVWAADGRSVVGTVTKTQGLCSAEHAESSRDLEIGNLIHFQDLLRTGPDARLASRLADGSELTLGENASLRVDEFVYTPDEGGGRLDIEALQGPFLFLGGRLDGDAEASVTIRTRVGTLGIRGTQVWGGAIDGAFGVLVLEGRVTVVNDAGDVVLGPGEGTMIEGPESPPGAPKNWPEEKVQRALESVSFGVD